MKKTKKQPQRKHPAVTTLQDVKFQQLKDSVLREIVGGLKADCDTVPGSA